MLIIIIYDSEELALETENDDAESLSGIAVSFTDNNIPKDDEGTAFVLESIKADLFEELSNSYGHYGHTINPEAITNLDLIAAISSLPSIKVVGELPELDYEPLPDDVES